MQRRQFLRRTAGAGLLAQVAREAQGARAGPAAEQQLSPSSESLASQIGRPVRVVSVGVVPGTPLEAIARLVDGEGSRGADIIALPEFIRGNNDAGSEETLAGPTISTMAPLARKHHTYIACPIDRKDGKARFNSVVLINREGRVVCIYNKVFPWWSEYRVRPPITPGTDAPVHQADFGRVGFATCFDVNFPEVWQRLADQQAELVVWPSWYSAGTSLQAHALDFHFYVVSSTRLPDCSLYDITGQSLLYSRGSTSNVSRITLDLDRGIYGSDFNLSKRDTLLKEHSDDIIQELWMPREEWFVLRAKRPGVSARKLARDYGLEELPHLIARFRREIDARRGWAFAKRSWSTPLTE